MEYKERRLKNGKKPIKIVGMTNKEVSELTGIAESTVRKYAKILEINYYGSGMHKVFDWKKTDVDRLKKSIGKRGRPPKTDN